MTAEAAAQRWLAEMVATAALDRIRPTMAAAGERVNDARRHVRSARSLAASDPTLAFAACHDAIRKAVTGRMVANSYRPKAGDGAHRIVVEYARRLLAGIVGEADIEDADAIRRDRALAEYGDFARARITTDHVRWAAGVAQRMVDAVATDLAGK